MTEINLINIIKKSFKDVVNHTTIALILVLFLIISNILANGLFTTQNFITANFLIICTFLIMCCFCSGWFDLLKTIAANKLKEQDNAFGVFFNGITENILKIIFSFIFYFAFCALFLLITLMITGKIAYHLYGSLEFLSNDTIMMLQSPQAYFDYINKLPEAQKVILNGWTNITVIGILFSNIVVNLLFVFYTPSIVSTNEKESEESKIKQALLKPFRAFSESASLMFKKFFNVLTLYIFTIFLFCSIVKLQTVLYNLFNQNQTILALLSLLFLFIFIYFLSFTIMLIFNCYENYSDNGANRIRENESFNQISENN